MALTKVIGSGLGAIPAISGANLTGLTDGQMPAGSALQVLSIKTSAGITTSATSFAATGLYLNITPVSTSSKIYATLNGGGLYNGTSAQTTQYITIYRGSTNLGNSTYGLCRFSTPGGSWSLLPVSCAVLDSPSSTSALKYEAYFKNANTSATVNFSESDRGEVTLTLMEIAG